MGYTGAQGKNDTEYGMQDSSRQPVEVHKLRRPRRTRALFVKGTALFLLIVFGVTHVYQYLGPNALVWLAGGVGLWLLFRGRRSASGAERARRGRVSGASHPELAAEIDNLDVAEFVRRAADVLRAQGYDVQPQAGPPAALVLTRGNERVWCTVVAAPADEPAITAAQEAARQHDCAQAMLLSQFKSSSQIEMSALRQGVVLIDQDEFIRLRSLQAKGHRVHAFRPRAANGSDVSRH